MTTRRTFLKYFSSAAICGGHPSLVALEQSPRSGKFLITVQAQGGWDVTCFCDPKINIKGEKEITWWSRENEPLAIGGLSYAPFAANEQFFKRHANKILIINGVDTQTNSHDTGITVSWSGRTALGYPSISALNSAIYGPSLPMSYISFGGFGNTESLIRSTIVSSGVDQLADLLSPNPKPQGLPHAIDPELWRLIRKLNTQDAGQYLADEKTVSGNRNLLKAYYQSMQNVDPLAEFSSTLGNAGDWGFSDDEYLKKQAFFAITAFSSGVSISADLLAPGNWDSHKDNDENQTSNLTQLTEGLDYIWDLAEAAGVADQLLVVVGSDFSRTPFYNAENGKDHWSTASYLVMEKNAKYANKTIGATDERHNALKVDPVTLEASNFGTKILTSHVHDALREHLGLANTATANIFPFNNTEQLNFFS